VCVAKKMNLGNENIQLHYIRSRVIEKKITIKMTILIIDIRVENWKKGGGKRSQRSFS